VSENAFFAMDFLRFLIVHAVFTLPANYSRLSQGDKAFAGQDCYQKLTLWAFLAEALYPGTVCAAGRWFAQYGVCRLILSKAD